MADFMTGTGMRIKRHETSAEQNSRYRSDLAEAASAEGISGRVCGEDCTLVCPQCGSTACQCVCSPDCEKAPQAMSVDPDMPIEPLIAPLVYEMKRLGLFTPCWSCEGHLGTDGTIWKVPRVWFYCDSTIHLRLLADGLKDLEMSRKLSARWQVVITFSDADNPATTFSLESAAPSDGTLQLPALQQDVRVIARSLEEMIVGQATSLQRSAETRLGARG